MMILLKRKLIVATILATVVLASTVGGMAYAATLQAPTFSLILADNVKKQLTTWLEESGGLNDWLKANPGSDLDPTWYQAKGEQELYQLLLGKDDSQITSEDFSKRMLDAAEDVVLSYLNAVDLAYESTKGDMGSLISRSDLKDFFNGMLVVGSRKSLTQAQYEPPSVVRGTGKGNTQYALPDANVSTTAWVQETAAGDDDADWFDELDEGFGAGRGSGSGPDDPTTNWRTGNSPSSETITTGLASVTDPVGNTGHIIRTRNRKRSGAKQLDLTIRLLQGGSQISAPVTWTDVGTTWTTRSDTLTATEADSITDYSALEIETSANAVGGGSPCQASESAHEFEVPDADGEPPPTIDSYGDIF